MSKKVSVTLSPSGMSSLMEGLRQGMIERGELPTPEPQEVDTTEDSGLYLIYKTPNLSVFSKHPLDSEFIVLFSTALHTKQQAWDLLSQLAVSNEIIMMEGKCKNQEGEIVHFIRAGSFWALEMPLK